MEERAVQMVQSPGEAAAQAVWPGPYQNMVAHTEIPAQLPNDKILKNEQLAKCSNGIETVNNVGLAHGKILEKVSMHLV